MEKLPTRLQRVLLIKEKCKPLAGHKVVSLARKHREISKDLTVVNLRIMMHIRNSKQNMMLQGGPFEVKGLKTVEQESLK